MSRRQTYNDDKQYVEADDAYLVVHVVDQAHLGAAELFHVAHAHSEGVAAVGHADENHLVTQAGDVLGGVRVDDLQRLGQLVVQPLQERHHGALHTHLSAVQALSVLVHVGRNRQVGRLLEDIEHVVVIVAAPVRQ